jgi:hypothetical protein
MTHLNMVCKLLLLHMGKEKEEDEEEEKRHESTLFFSLLPWLCKLAAGSFITATGWVVSLFVAGWHSRLSLCHFWCS